MFEDKIIKLKAIFRLKTEHTSIRISESYTSKIILYPT